MRTSRLTLGALLLGVVGQLPFASSAIAQSLPSGCVPTGSTHECTAILLGPYDYTHNTCGTRENRATEAESFQDELNEWSGVCGLETSRIGWLTAQQQVGYCGISDTGIKYGLEFELGNVSRYTFTYRDTCASPIKEVTNYAVMRRRELFCPQGYGQYTSGGISRCRREVAKQEPQKSLGAPKDACCGNPINPAIANKYEEETDYQDSVSDALLVKRYYNSAYEYLGMRTFYSALDVWNGSWLGYAKYGKLAMHPESDRYRLMAMDAIGAQWRHHYQRAIYVNATTSMTSALAYRHDGKVINFNLYQGTFVAQADISDRLVQLPDGRLQFTNASDDSVEIYLPDGHLESIRSRGGQTQTVSYDECERIASVTDDFGHDLQFNYDLDCNSAGRIYRITSIELPDGALIGYGYSVSNGTLTSVTYPGGHVRGYTYGGWNGRLLTGIIDEQGQPFATWTYDVKARPISSTHAGGVDQIGVTYQYIGNVAPWQVLTGTVTDSLGAITKYYYGPIRGTNRLNRIERPHPSGTGTMSEYWTFDTNGNVATYKNYRAFRTDYSYDLTRNLETSRTEGLNSNGTTNPETRTITTQWHPTFRMPTLITESGRTTAFTYDTNGNPLNKTITDTTTSSSRTWTWAYDSFGRMLTENGPRTDVADVTTYTYYTCTTGFECGQLATVTNAAGHVVTYSTYNAHGQSLTIIDSNGVLTTLVYDARQRLTSRTVGGEITGFAYWPTGLLKRVTSPDGAFIEYTYDAAHRLTQIADDENNRVVYTLDAIGNRVQEQNLDPSGAIARTHFRTVDALNRLKQEIGSAN